MKALVPTFVFLGLIGNAQAHESEMPLVLHLAEHGWLLMALLSISVVLLPLLRTRR